MNGLSTPPASLAQWLEYQQTVHPTVVDLGLARVHSVARRLQIGRIAKRIYTVAGTNGKGSSVAILAAIQRAAGRRVGCYTSPHLLDYRERIALPRGLVSEPQLVDAFSRIERAREQISLTQFEFGTLAALLCLAESDLDTAVLEVGLGGRLDAVNLVDADAVLITTIGLDHQAWLGDDLESIGREKAGVLRAGQVAVYADQPAVRSVLEQADMLGCGLLRPGVHYRYWREGRRWLFQDTRASMRFPWPTALHAPTQIHNLAACVALTLALEPQFPAAALTAGISAASIAGRLQRLSTQPEVWLDIAHNPQAAASLRDWLHTQPARPTLAVFGALADKDVAAVVDALSGSITHWHLAPLDALSARGLSLPLLQQRLPAHLQHSLHDTVAAALNEALAQAMSTGARVLAFGSFVLAEQILRDRHWNAAAAAVSFAPERQ